MNSKTAIKRIARLLSDIPHAHDGLGKTASCKGALSYNADMREIVSALFQLALDCDDLSLAQIDKRLKEVEATAKRLKTQALKPD